MKICWPGGIVGLNYVECKLCMFAGCKITQHVMRAHGICKKVYEEKYGSTVCLESSKKYGATDNCNWIERKKAAGEDLAEYRTKMSLSVSNSIMSDLSERARRASVLGALNKRQDFRDRSSKAAKITSARPEVIANRTEQLRRWRCDHPEEFQAALEKALKMSSSRPEKLLLELCREILGNDTTAQLQIQHPLIPTKSHRARVDIANKALKVLVEFDGPFHFKPILGEERLMLRKARDKGVERYAVENGYVLIRVSYDTFNGKIFENRVLDCLRNVSNMKSCVVKIGNLYSSEKRLW